MSDQLASLGGVSIGRSIRAEVRKRRRFSSHEARVELSTPCGGAAPSMSGLSAKKRMKTTWPHRRRHRVDLGRSPITPRV